MTDCVGDWMRLRCGDRVVELDGRHVGRVEAIHHGAWVKVRWLETSWVSMLPLGAVRKLKREELI
jgi:hypothetical protein